MHAAVVIRTGMRLSFAHVLALGAIALSLACSRPGEKRCAKVCDHYLDLYLTDKYAEQLKTAEAPEARAELEEQMAAERAQRRTDEKYGFQQCINRCNRRSRGSVADCIESATTLDDAKGCDAEEEACTVAVSPGRDSTSGLLLVGFAVLLLRRRRRSSR